MKPRVVLALAGATTLLVATGVAARVASTDRPSPFTAEYRQTALWDGGLLGTFMVGNTSDRAATDWSIEFELPRDTKLAGVWNGELFASKSTYVIKPTAPTRTVGAHRSIRVGLSMIPGGPVGGSGGGVSSSGVGPAGASSAARSPIVPRNCTINGKTCTIVTVKAALGPAATGGPATGNAAPDGTVPGGSVSGGSVSGGTVSGGSAASGHSERGASPAAPTRPTTFAPAVNMTNAGRPQLKDIAEVSGASALTLVSALPAAGGRCDLQWGGGVEPTAYAREIADALDGHVALIASIGAANDVDLAHACGSVAALEAEVKKVLALGLRSIDVTIASASLAAGSINGGAADDAAHTRLAQAVARLKTQYPGLTVSYSLPAVPGRPDLTTRPLLAARSVGAVIDRVNVLPVDVAAPLDVLKPLLGGAGAAGNVDSLLATVTGVHDQVMKIQGVDPAAAWRMIGVIPVAGVGDLVDPSSRLVDAVAGLAEFARSTGLGLVGFLPLNTGQTCLGGLVGQLLALPAIPLLSCVDSASLPGFFTIVDGVNRVLR